MTGMHHIEIENKRVKYIIDIKRKVTVIKGNSGTGKTTLINMLRGYMAQGSKSGIHVRVNTSAELVVLDSASRWELDIAEKTGAIFFVDESVDYIYTKFFQQEFSKSPNYLVVISRSGKFNHLPYAIESIYELKTEQSDKLSLTKMYQLYKVEDSHCAPNIIITEDSGSGLEMMEKIFSTRVVPASGNSNVVDVLFKYILEGSSNKIFVVVDGAAFGGFVANLINLSHLSDNIEIFAPESFEYLLLKTDIFSRKLNEELTHTWKFCDISKYLTWEQYYMELLMRLCSESNFSYSKSQLNQAFKNEAIYNQIKKDMYHMALKELT